MTLMSYVSRLARVGCTCAAIALTTLSIVSAAHAQFGTNRLLNGDAEASVGSEDGDFNGAPTNWTVTAGNFTAANYIAPGSPVPTADQGLNYFAGGQSVAFSSGLQNISIADVSALVDLGNVGFDASGYFGGFGDQNDNTILRLTFLSGTNISLGVATVGGVMAADRNDVTSLLFRELTGSVPVGTRTIAASLEMTRTDGSYNDGYVDNVAVKLTNSTGTVVPESGTLALALSALGIVGAVLIRRKIA